jgi:hypothetical protein
MPIIALIFLAIAFYFLFVKGFAYPLLSLVICYFASKQLEIILPYTHTIIATILSYNVSLAMFLATLIWILSIGFFLKEDD